MNHYLEGGVDLEQFSVFVTLGGDAPRVHTPMWSRDQTVRQALDVIWTRLFQLVEQFAGSFLSLRRHRGFGFRLQSRGLDSTDSAWEVVLDERIATALMKDSGADA